MKNLTKRYFGKVTKVNEVIDINDAPIFIFSMHVNLNRFGCAETFDDLMFSRDINVIMVGKEVKSAAKKITEGSLCEVYGIVLDLNTIYNIALEEGDITKYVLTDNIVLHNLS